jgi:hypothetical protein
MGLPRFWSRQPRPTTASQVVPAAPMVAPIWCRPWAGSLLPSNPCHPRELARTAMSTPSHTMLRTKTTCTISKINRSAAQIARNRIITTPTSRGWATICGLHRCSRSVAPICITNYLQVENLEVITTVFTGSGYTPVFYTKISLLLVLACSFLVPWTSCMAVIWALQGLISCFVPTTCSTFEIFLCLDCSITFPLLHSTLYLVPSRQQMINICVAGLSFLGAWSRASLKRLARASMTRWVCCGFILCTQALSLDWYLMKDSRPPYRLYSARCASIMCRHYKLSWPRRNMRECEG